MPRPRPKGNQNKKKHPAFRADPDRLEEFAHWAACHGLTQTELFERVFRAYQDTHGVEGSPRTEKWVTERQDPEAWTRDGRFVGYGYDQPATPASHPETDDGEPEMALGKIDVSALMAERRARRNANGRA